MAERRREEETDAFRTRYKKRSGIEATNSVVKRKTGLGKLRVRGKPKVFNSILLKIVGWNIFRAASCLAMSLLVQERA
ncbi:MAG: transposase [Oleispira sp.]|nr:transposase [Oleispira sp.]